MGEDLVNIGFLAKSYGSILGVVQYTDSEKPTDRSEVNELKKSPHFLFDVRG